MKILYAAIKSIYGYDNYLTTQKYNGDTGLISMYNINITGTLECKSLVFLRNMNHK